MTAAGKRLLQFSDNPLECGNSFLIKEPARSTEKKCILYF